MTLFVLNAHRSRRFNPGAHSEGKVLPGTYALCSGDYDSCNYTESNLGNDKPKPVNPPVHHGIDCFENVVEQTGPQSGGYQTSKENRATRKHRKCRTIKKTDEQRTDKVNDRSNDQSVPMKDTDLRCGGSVRKESSGQKVDRIPDAVAADNSIKHCKNSHADTSCEAALHTC